MGQFEEHGAQVRGHGHVLRRALSAELGRSGAFNLVADDAAKRQALRRIKADLSRVTSERQWVEVGRAVGATHLLLGEVQEDRDTCFAFAQLVHLESQKAKVSLPESYDCTRAGLVEAAGALSMQLAGRRASTPRARPTRQKTVKIVLHDNTAIVGDERYTFDEDPPEVPDASVAEPAEPAEPAPSRGAAVADASDEDVTTPVEPPAPDAWRPPFDLERWPGLDEPTDGYTIHNLARWIVARREIVTSALLLLPLGLVFVGGALTRARPSIGHRLLRYGFFVSVLALSLEVAIVLFYRWVLARSILEDVDPLLLAAPPVSVLLWLVGVRLVRAADALSVLRQIPWALLAAAYFLVLLLIASQIRVPLALLGGVTLVFFVAMRVMAALRRRRDA